MIATFLIHGFSTKVFRIKRNVGENNKPICIILNIVSILFYFLGIILILASAYCVKMWGLISAEQMIINMISPTTGTSDEIILSIIKDPVLLAIFVVTLFRILLFNVKKSYIIQ